MSDAPRQRDTRALVDAHVHFYPGYDLGTFFRAAAGNLSEAAHALGIDEPWTGILVLTEVEGGGAFRSFSEAADVPAAGGPAFSRTAEEVSLLVPDHEPGGAPLVVVAGRQIQTREGLEVLGLGTPGDPPDGMSIGDAIDATVEAGAIPVLPWGFGKWTLGRRRVVEGILDSRRPRDFLVADTAHRPRAKPRPALLLRAEADGVPMLTGSDPVPLSGEELRPGSSCFALTGPEMGDRPARWLRSALEGLERSPPRYQRPQSRTRCAYRQVAMQLRKRTGGRFP